MDDELQPLKVTYPNDRPPRKMEWLVHGLLPMRTFGIIGGEPESYKTWFALDVAITLAVGGNTLGWGAEKECKTLVYSPEGEGESLRRRLFSLCQGRGVDWRVVLGKIGVIGERVNISDTESYMRLAKTIIVHHPDLLILDPMVSIHRANENDANEIQPVLDQIRDLRLANPDLTCIIVHHTKKQREGESAGYSLRGSSAIYGWEDTLISIRKEQAALDMSPRIVNVSHRDAIGCRPRKFNIIQSGDSGIRLNPIEDPFGF